MMQDRISRRTFLPSHRALCRFSVTRAGLVAVFMAWASASAHAGQPLILDTQMGISDGQPGQVLQNAPLSHEPMVQAPDSSQPYIVAPYVEVPAGGGSGGRPNPPPRPPHRPAPPLPQPLPAAQ